MPPVVTPDDRALRLSRRAIVLGSLGVLVAAVALATLGFSGPQAAAPAPTPTVAHVAR